MICLNIEHKISVTSNLCELAALYFSKKNRSNFCSKVLLELTNQGLASTNIINKELQNTTNKNSIRDLFKTKPY